MKNQRPDAFMNFLIKMLVSIQKKIQSTCSEQKLFVLNTVEQSSHHYVRFYEFYNSLYFFHLGFPIDFEQM